MRQYLGFISYFICIAQILMFVSVDIKAQEQKRIVYSDVLKTLEEHTCLECHSTNKREGNVDLSNYEGIVKVLKPGHASQSLLVHAVEIRMMPALRFSDSSLSLTLSPEDLTLIEDWINSGASLSSILCKPRFAHYKQTSTLSPK